MTPAIAFGAAGAVAIIGPPGSGKTALADHLADRYQSQVLSLPDLSRRRADRDPVFAATMADLDGRLDALPDSLATFILMAAVGDGPRPCPERPILLDGYPGSAVQAAHLVHTLRTRFAASLAVIELHADNLTARARVRTRAVTCAACRCVPGERMVLQRPCWESAEWCTCRGQACQPGAEDRPDRVNQRLARFRQRAPMLRWVLEDLSVPVELLSTEPPQREVADAAERFLATASHRASVRV